MAPLDHYRRPWLFYGLSTAIPWAFWLGAIWISHRVAPSPRLAALLSLFGLLGIVAPMFVAFTMIGADRHLRSDCCRRLRNISAAKPVYWLLALGLMPASILLAIFISLLFGYDASQFRIATTPSFTSGVVSTWAVLLVVPVIEEMAWHTYGTDTLRRRFTLFATCIIFSTFWGIWHAPLVLVDGYYHSNLMKTGIWELVNFPVSIFPVVFLMNWLYTRAARNIWIAALFHVTSGFFNELFSPHPRTKLIQTGILIIVAAVVVMKNRQLFFSETSSLHTANPPRLSGTR